MLIRIGSQDNNRIKLIRKLDSRKGRVRERKFIAEGINLVSEAVRRQMDIDFIMVPDNWKDSSSAQFIQECAASDHFTVCEVPCSIFDRLTDAGNGVGLLAVVSMPETDISCIGNLPEGSNILVLDRVQDPGNIGTMIRTAVAAGYGMIIGIKGTADIYSPKVIRSTAGMIFDIPFVCADDAAELCSLLRSAGRRVAVTDPAGGRPYYEEDLRNNIALVIGNEGNGISDEMMTQADIRITLPMKGEIESLNAAVSAAILMYEAVRE